MELLKVGMFQHLLDGDPPLGVELEHLVDKVHGQFVFAFQILVVGF